MPFGLEAGQHLAAVHAGFDQLQRHPPTDGLVLLGHPDRPHPPFADLLQQFVGTDLIASHARVGLINRGCHIPASRRGFQKTGLLKISLQQNAHSFD